jgi:outer membrane protein insertion porin family
MKTITVIAILVMLGASNAFAQQFRLGRLEFRGNYRTKESLIRRMIPLEEGDIFDTTRWDLGMELLNRSGLFNPISSSDAAMSLDPSRGIVDIVLNLTERDHQRIDLSGGGGTTGGTSVGFDYSNINLSGRADRLAARLQLGTRESVYQASYSATTLTKLPIRLDISGSYQRLEFVDARTVDTTTAERENRPLFIERSGRASLGASFAISRFARALVAPTRAGLIYSFTYTRLIDSLTQPGVITDEPPQDNLRVASLTPFVTHDTLDRDFDPTKGERLLIATEIGARLLGGNISVISPTVDYRRFFPVGRNNREPRVFGLRVRASHIAGRGGPRDPRALSTVGGVPISRRFFLGGENEVRGYDVNSISPLARVERFLIAGGNQPVLISSDTRPTGGDTQLIFNSEYRVPIIWRFSAAAFFDIGASLNARGLGEERFETTTQLEPGGTPATVLTVLRRIESEARLPNYRVSVGGELRFMIPMLNVPLRLIFAANPNAQRRPPESTLIAPEKRFAFRFGFSRTL